MKKGLVILMVGMMFFGACSAQRVEAQSANNAQKIIGTWVDNSGITWVFNVNGTLTRGTEEFKFGVADTKLAIVSSDEYGTSDGSIYRSGYIFNISISSDGKTLILSFISDNRSGYWLTKK